MENFLCWIWPYLMGGLLGWLAAGWLARRALARRPSTVERVVEMPVDRFVEKVVDKVVDNPAHLAQIATLTATAALVPQLRGQLSALEAAPPKVVEKVVERIVEKPVDRVVEKVVERIVEMPVEVVVERIVDRPVDRVVERVVDRMVDNPAHLAQIAALTATAALVPQLRSQLSALEAAPPKVVETVVERVIEKVVERPVVDTVALDALDARERDLASVRARYADLEARYERLDQGLAIDLAAARAAGFSIKHVDELEVIDGIGPKIADLLRHAGVKAFWQLAKMTPAEIKPILDAAGPSYKLADPSTWPEQAALAANNHWLALKALIDNRTQPEVPPAAAVERVVERTVEVPVERIVEKTVIDTARVDALEQELDSLRGQNAGMQAQLQRWRDGPAVDLGAARAAGFTIRHADELEVIEGIGPKIAELLRAAGVHRFWQLSAMSPAQIQPILDAAGAHFKLADPATWPEQALLAAHNHWPALKTLQDTLTAGRRG